MASRFHYKSIPIFINARDLVTPLRSQVSWLLDAGYRSIYILDNDSTYPPLLDYYQSLAGSDVNVLRLGANFGHKAIWDAGILKALNITTPYVYTDPDIVPIDECPKNLLEFYLEVLRAYPHKSKVGFGLLISDLPAHYRFREKVIVWESQFWTQRLTPKLYDAPVDTTFALYRPGTCHDLSGIRSGFPYVARHQPWYQDSERLTVEQQYYLARAKPGTNSWSGKNLPAELNASIEQLLRAQVGKGSPACPAGQAA